MASFTKISESKRARNKRNAGRARKAKLGQRSTLSYEELFAKCGAPRDAKASEGSSSSGG